MRHAQGRLCPRRRRRGWLHGGSVRGRQPADAVQRHLLARHRDGHEHADGGRQHVPHRQQDGRPGTYTGTSTDEARIIIHSDGSANITGSGVCTCTVDGRSGTFEYRFQGSGIFPSTLDGHYVVRHGTGGLEGLHAEGPFSGNFTAVVYGGQHPFDPA